MLSLREPFGGDIPDSARLKRRGLSFFLSLLFHLFVFFLVVILFPPLGTNTKNRKVADVIIVPPEKLFLPNPEQHSRAVTAVRQDLAAGIASLPVTPGGSAAVPENLQPDPALSARFKLVLPESINTSELSSDFSFDLALDREDRFFPPVPELEAENKLDLSKYANRSYLSEYRARYFDDRKRSNRTDTGGTVSVQGKPWDISPWANKVVAEIQRNWFLSPQQNEVPAGLVEIAVVISRSGKIVSTEVLTSSRIEQFDQAALKAIKIAPIPQLPNGFPADQLQISLVFLVQ